MILEKKIPISYWFKLVNKDLLLTSCFATTIYFLSKYFVNFEVPISLGTFLGTSIALLLSFKLSQSYDRWWEARKIWGAIVNDSRTIVLQLSNYSKKEGSELVEQMAMRQIAWSYSLACRLRNQDPGPYLSKFLNAPEIKALEHHKNLPLALLNHQSAGLKVLHERSFINDYQQMQIDSTLVRLCDSLGKSERIKNTVFPKTYRMTLQFFIYLFLILLSFALTDLDSWIEIPLLVMISIPFFLLENISKNIQNPFDNKPSDTPILSISKTIEVNIKQLLERDDLPDEYQKPSFYVM